MIEEKEFMDLLVGHNGIRVSPKKVNEIENGLNHKR